jgi:hypothetical protein
MDIEGFSRKELEQEEVGWHLRVDRFEHANSTSICLNQVPKRLFLAVKLADVIIVNVQERDIYVPDDFVPLLRQILKMHAMSHQK